MKSNCDVPLPNDVDLNVSQLYYDKFYELAKVLMATAIQLFNLKCTYDLWLSKTAKRRLRLEEFFRQGVINISELDGYLKPYPAGNLYCFIWKENYLLELCRLKEPMWAYHKRFAQLRARSPPTLFRCQYRK